MCVYDYTSPCVVPLISGCAGDPWGFRLCVFCLLYRGDIHSTHSKRDLQSFFAVESFFAIAWLASCQLPPFVIQAPCVANPHTPPFLHSPLDPSHPLHPCHPFLPNPTRPSHPSLFPHLTLLFLPTLPILASATPLLLSPCQLDVCFLPILPTLHFLSLPILSSWMCCSSARSTSWHWTWHWCMALTRQR